MTEDTIEKNTGAEFDEDIFSSMLDGSFEESTEEVEDDSVEDEVEDTVVDDEDDSEHQEDTDLIEEDEEDDTDEAGDGELDEEEFDEDEDEEEDSLVEDNDSDDEDGDIEDEEDEADEAEELEDEDIDEVSEDDTDTEAEADGTEAETTDEVDYKAFYDAVVNTEFTVNGRKTKGFADPQKIIQSQQMAGGYSEKMAGFKKYRPYMAPLKDRGMLEDQAKFDLAMNLIDGDKEAIKQHLASLNIDPMELDMETINYSGKTNTASAESLIIEDVMERAKGAGIEDRVRQVIGTDWDPESFNEFVTNDAVRNDLLDHMESGAYDRVQEKMHEMSRLDYNGQYGNMRTVDKYRAAVKLLQAEAPAPQAPVTPVVRKVAKKATPSVDVEKAKILKERKEAKYKKDVASKNAKASADRKRAASASKKKPKSKPKAKFDPMKLEGDELDAHMEFLISGGR